MSVTTEALREVQARIVHDLGRSDGVAPRETIATGTNPRALDLAIANLRVAGLVEEEEGVLRLGARTSPLSAARTRTFRRAPGLGEPLESHAVVTSTNDLALEGITNESVGRTIVAELQTAGRGRRSRAFESHPGLGIWCSTVLDAAPEPSRAGRLSLIVAMAVAEAVEVSTRVRPLVKWPNDVRIGGRKVAGILVEARSSGRTVLPVAGVGIYVHNVPTDFPENLRGAAGSLASTTGAALDRSRVLAALLDALTKMMAKERLGELDLVQLFSTYDELRLRDVSVLQGERLLRGRADGIAEDGGLRLEIEGEGLRVVHGGEATVAEMGG